MELLVAAGGAPAHLGRWHGATLASAMVHIAIQETDNGLPVEWMEQVPDEAHRAGRA